MAVSNSTTLTNASSNPTSSSVSENPTKAIFLVLIMLVGIFGNFILVISIGCNKKQRNSALQLFSLNLAVVNCFDCFVNMPIALVSSVTTTWNINEAVCRINSFFMNLVWIETILGLTFMSLDRMMATRHSSKYDQFQSMPRFIIMIIYTWVHSISFSLPLLFAVIPVKVYSNLNVCLMSQTVSIAYTCMLTLGCFLLPLTVSLVFFSLSVKTSCTERSIRAIKTRNQYSKELEEPRAVHEIKGTKYTGILLFFWIFLEVPFIAAMLVRLFRYSEDLDIRDNFEIKYSVYADVTLLLLKFSYVTVLPVLALLWKKELWQQFKNCILCRKSNLIVDMTYKEEGPQNSIKSEKLKLADEKKQAKEERLKEAFVHNSGFQVPVLFATSHGVHIQTGVEEESEYEYEDIRINAKKCDVLGSQGNLQHYGDETSDYDSSNELDPFSISHPISAKKLNSDVHPTLQKRSNSQPEVRNTSKKEKVEATKVSITTTSAADSGLDISNQLMAQMTSDIAQKAVKQFSSGDDEVQAEDGNPILKETQITSCNNTSSFEPEIKNQFHLQEQILSVNLLKANSDIIKGGNSAIHDDKNLSITKMHNTDSSYQAVGSNSDDTFTIKSKPPPRLSPLVMSPLKSSGNGLMEDSVNIHEGNTPQRTKSNRKPLYVKLPSLPAGYNPCLSNLNIDQKTEKSETQDNDSFKCKVPHTVAKEISYQEQMFTSLHNIDHPSNDRVNVPQEMSSQEQTCTSLQNMDHPSNDRVNVTNDVQTIQTQFSSSSGEERTFIVEDIMSPSACKLVDISRDFQQPLAEKQCHQASIQTGNSVCTRTETGDTTEK